MKKYLSVIIILFLSSCGSSKMTTPNIETIIASQNFTINKPDNWRPFIDHGFISYTPLKKGDNMFNNSVSIFKYSLKNKPSSLKKFSLSQINQTNNVLNIKSQEAETIEGSQLGDIYVHKFESIWNDIKYKKYEVYFEHEGEYYSYTYSSIIDEYNNHYEEAMSILLSIKFK